MLRNISRLIVTRSQSSSLPRYLSTVTSTVTKGKEDSELFMKLVGFGSCSASNVTDALDECVKEGKSFKRIHLIGYIFKLRKFRKYPQALQLYEWMEKNLDDVNNSDRAICIDLLSKTEGVVAAENYFNGLQETAKTQKTYGALLNCYCKTKKLEKALELFEKMKELNFTNNCLNYNNVMALYMKVGQPEKVSSLVQEMEEKKIPADFYTYHHLMNSYAELKDFEAVEGVLEKMQINGVKNNWLTYANLATIYVNAGQVDKAKAALQKLEEMKDLRDREASFHTLITLYARLSDLTGINRAWESLKSAHPQITNVSYLVMLLSLYKMNEMDALEKYFREWESSCSIYDVRVANVVLKSYLNRNMIEEANLLADSVLKRGVGLNLKALDLFMNLYLEKHQIDLALKYLEEGASKENQGKNRQFPFEETMSKFLRYFEEEKDVDSAEKFCTSMKKISCLNSRIHDSLLRTYVAAGKVEPNMRQRMKEDGVEISPETEKLLDKVCPN